MAYVNPWSLLEIDREADKRTIKRAYAAKLKQIDPDRDVEGFLALRQALEAALSYERTKEFDVRHVLSDVEPFEDECSVPSQNHQEDITFSLREAAEKSETTKDQLTEKMHALEALLYEDDPDEGALNAQTDDILTLLGSEAIDRVVDVENWFAEILIYCAPRGDNILPKVYYHFGWAAELDSHSPRHAIVHPARRAEFVLYIEELSKPKHPWHMAYQILSSQVNVEANFRTRTIYGREIINFLDDLRIHYPDLEREFDPHIVEVWDKGVPITLPSDVTVEGKLSWYSWLWIVIVVIWIALILFG